MKLFGLLVVALALAGCSVSEEVVENQGGKSKRSCASLAVFAADPCAPPAALSAK